MRRFFIVLLLIGAMATPFPATFAQKRGGKANAATATATAAVHGVDQITAQQMRDYLYFIASDEMEGRDTPSRGLDTTAKFIAMNLSRWGFKPGGDDGTFFQHIALRRDKIDASQTRLELNGQTYKPGEDFIAVGNGGSASGQLVYAGNGWLIKSKNMDAYQGIDAKDKIVVVTTSMNGLPKGVVQTDLKGTRGVDWMDPGAYAEKQGAKAILLVPDFQILSGWERTRQNSMERGVASVAKAQTVSSSAPLRIILSPRLAATLFQGEKQNANALFDAYASGNTAAPFALKPDKQVSINVVAKNDPARTQNVVAIWEGSDPVLKNEYVAVGAHYDHIGISPTPDKNGDSINNGADDDGSGTTAILSMAEALAHTTPRPKRSILFVWHCGEEKGLWGSRYFTDNPTVPLDKVVAQLNIDMIGRSKKEGDTNPLNAELTGPNEIYVIGSTMMSTELGQLSNRVNQSYLNLGYNVKYDDPADPNRFFFRSDHFNYARKGIPIIFFFDGVHEDYHRPGDEPQKIDYDKMQKVTRTVYLTMWEVANLPTRPAVDKPLPEALRGN
ncbi:MAG TPA: M28 family peptidase [Pyrinomonadaceae bacterium]|jgi:Zn-dependent M28 family amino/carboxypeptidase|nr:M28 family peptidase [Pyrinomonadaceae bacterium]